MAKIAPTRRANASATSESRMVNVFRCILKYGF
jgi:hypothetical protein